MEPPMPTEDGQPPEEAATAPSSADSRREKILPCRLDRPAESQACVHARSGRGRRGDAVWAEAVVGCGEVIRSLPTNMVTWPSRM